MKARTKKSATKRVTKPALPTKPGVRYGGGIYAARLFDGIKPYLLIVAPRTDGEIASATWSESGKAVKALRIAGLKDWSLPNRAEALAMFEHLREKVAKTPDTFESSWYWTSAQYASVASSAWIQYFYGGYQGYGHEASYLRARAVRRIFI